MSSNLYIEPVNRKRKTLSTELKFALRKRYGEPIKNKQISVNDIDYFKGLLDAGIVEAQIVLDMIEKYDTLEITEEW